jgi:hypothetical protein
MSITPLHGGSSEERKSTSSSSPFSPVNNSSLHSMGIGENSGGGESKGQNHKTCKFKEKSNLNHHNHQHPHWPPLGPPPIFGRHRAQHSAPRGGPPRAWSNSDLTEALHNVWNKKMTTSQVSEIKIHLLDPGPGFLA